jgi:ABC-2 type transport system ATP-binding protein
VNQSPIAIEARDLCRTYKRAKQSPLLALDNVSLTFHQGTWAALLGPNGAGKSTLLRILATLDTPDSGTVQILGHTLPYERTALRRKLSVVFQKPGLDPLLTVRENLLCQAAVAGMPNTTAQLRINEIAQRFNIDDRLHDRLGTLSGGLIRRVDLARALLSDPSLLLLDEPTAGLDHDARHEYLELLATLQSERTLTIVMSTHLMDEADRADLVALLNEGKLVHEGAPDSLRASVGGRILRTTPKAREHLDTSTLRLDTHHAELICTGDDVAIRHAAQKLLDASIQFEIGPPTLGDAYLHLTGTHLLSAPAGETP